MCPVCSAFGWVPLPFDALPNGLTWTDASAYATPCGEVGVNPILIRRQPDEADHANSTNGFIVRQHRARQAPPEPR
jgi:hypothetical protein